VYFYLIILTMRKPLNKIRGLRRPCKMCNKIFQPTGKFQRCCVKCLNKSQKNRSREGKNGIR
jgi:hypothetical protein